MYISECSLDEGMLTKDSLFKILHWATSEGRIHLLHELTEPGMRFLWSRQQSQIVTKINTSTARIHHVYLCKLIIYFILFKLWISFWGDKGL